MAPPGYWAHGRYYGNWRSGKYLFPIDSEELNRLDIFHKFFLVARENALTKCKLENLNHPARVLDLGTGSGIWAIEICEQFAESAVQAVDRNMIQPRLIRNKHWRTVYRNIFQHLAPDGCLEQVEIDWNPQWEEHGEVPPDSALTEWANCLLDALDLCKRSARISPHNVRSMIEEAGFDDFKEQTIKCYVNPWSPYRNERETAKWFNLGLRQGMEAMGLRPMVEHLGMSVEQVRSLCERAIEENSKLRYRGYCTM
ncbi:methyl transferase [Purpureocillium lavendulum]|uniref:Methyl transferase n=1 Tax=Purpureocillium lavendulum TaxID=1247861 RepID=A0AB34FDP5_9HYPO|nr:methyl transferase [Purpureocillium lavendulum]